MKNYTYGWVLEDKGYIEVPEIEYNNEQNDMKIFVESMSEVVKAAECGWSGVKYKVMKHTSGATGSYMVLWVKGGGSRWIPIEGNSKGCNFSVLGENLW